MADRERTELSARYAAASVEPRVYQRWLDSGGFAPAAEPRPAAERFVITMPPPNVTGSLHTGHAMFVTAEDLLIRYHRMRGDDTLWVPGVDHASIAAQFVLDKILAAEGEDRASLGRERYLERMWQFMDETRDAISRQMHRLGASADWNRSRFTMDDPQRPVGARRLQTAVGRRVGVPRRGPRQLVPPLPNHDQRPREHPSRRGRHPVDHPLSPGRRRWLARSGAVDRHRHHPPGDAAWRRRSRGPSRRRSLSVIRRA